MSRDFEFGTNILECTDVRKPVADPDLQISGGAVTPNPEIRGGGRPVSKNIFLALQASEFGLKIRGAGSTDPSPGSTTVNPCESDFPKKKIRNNLMWCKRS